MTERGPGDLMRAEAIALADQFGSMLGDVLKSLDTRPGLPRGAADALRPLNVPLPEEGDGMQAVLDKLLELNRKAGANTGGPRSFHFVIGGSTPAALGADLLATAYDALAYTWITSPVAVELELRALAWLKDLFGLPSAWSGVMVTGATMANFVCLASARQWWGEQQGVDVSEQGLSGLPEMPVLTSGYVHAATLKCLSLLGTGRSQLTVCGDGKTGALDIDRMADELDSLEGRPAVMIINAGEVNTGDFDPVRDLLDLARQHQCWVHVDGAFGLFARVSPRTAHLAEGVERADSVAVDGHKWLNVPYDSGFAFVRSHGLQARAFRYSADYLPDDDDPRPTIGSISPESSRRARGFAVWATLAAYGRSGQQQIVEHCLELAQQLRQRVDESTDFERLAEVPLNIVAFRYNPGGLSDTELDQLNSRLGEALLEDGRFLAGTSRWGQRTIFRPAFSNWRTRPEDVDEFVDVLRELGGSLLR